jgi:NAD(P)H-hydrate epimerase
MSLKVYSSEQLQQWDKFTIEQEPIASIDLMERAATLATKSILGRNSFEKAAIFCGPGNNGGDGLVIARLLHESEFDVTVVLLDFAEPTSDFKNNYERLDSEINVVRLNEKEYNFNLEADLIIDAIFGSGLNRPVDGWIAEVISNINSLNIKTIAIDIPSGLFAINNKENTGFPSVIEADETLTFMSPKMAFFYAEYAKNVGNFRIIDIALHPDFKSESFADFITIKDVSIKSRSRFDHKGTSGCLMIVAGFEEMTGAAIIASKAALRSGSRYLFTSCDEKGKTGLNAAIPEAIWKSPHTFEIPTKCMAIAVGPGLGTSDFSKETLIKVLQSNLPQILDADALNLLSANKDLLAILPKGSILTPHLGELKRLIGEFEHPEDLLQAQLAFSAKHKVYIIQKGPFSKLTTPSGRVIVNSSGNPGMSTAGMGDALTGIIGAFLSQGCSAEAAAINGMFIHGYAADEIAKNHGQIGLLATDVIEQLPRIINRFAV